MERSQILYLQGVIQLKGGIYPQVRVLLDVSVRISMMAEVSALDLIACGIVELMLLVLTPRVEVGAVSMAAAT